MRPFHIAIHAAPADAAEGPPQEIDGRQVTPLAVSPAALVAPLGVTFDEAAAALGKLPRIFLEPDGSLLWTSASGPAGWQIDGVLYDRGDRLHYVELKGRCPAEEFDTLLRAFGWPRTPVVFQLLREGVVLSESAFRSFFANELDQR
jgi:hypothetical protein